MAQVNEWARTAGQEPIPGYRLVEPLGRGGFGEVWKCEVPGGLFKAMKFVSDLQQEKPGATSAAAQELESLQRVKAIRHPFLLSMDRVEVVDGDLVIVMELADKSLHNLQVEYQGQNLPGVPRDELLGYLAEAAEVLDWMNFTHNLQHLDIKPHNLFVVTNHVKIADFGLVHSLGEADSGHAPQRRGGVTPLYAAPEILRGTLSRHSDQYSLAIVYQQLLTGTVPFWHANAYQLMLLHLTADPSLEPLPFGDRPAVARALAKVPEHRFPSCLDFVQALLSQEDTEPPVAPTQGPARPSGPGRRSSTVIRRITYTPRQDEPGPGNQPPPAQPCPADERTRIVATPEEFAATQPPSAATTPVTTQGKRAPRPDGTGALAADAARTPGNGPQGGMPGPGGPNAIAPTSVALPGYRFLQCHSQSPLGDIWKVQDDQGREGRALCLYSFVGHDPQLITRLQAIRHPAIPEAQIHWSPSGRLVVVTEPVAATLRDRFDECRSQGQQGVPCEEFLGYLEVVAEAVDALTAEHGIGHLCLNPRNVILRGDSAAIADYGLVPLVWLPTGQPAGQLSPRYAAPELFDRRDSRAADQFSLAMIFAEMVSGVPPKQYRGPVGGPGSGAHRRVPRNTSPNSVRPARRSSPRIDLDLLPPHDREVLGRALSDAPEQRFGSCTELMQALRNAEPSRPKVEELYRNLPAVIPYSSLMGESAPADTLLPAVNQVVAALVGAGRRIATQVLQAPDQPVEARFTSLPGGGREYHCPIHLTGGPLHQKLAMFQHQWGTRAVRESDSRFVLHLDLRPSRRVWERSRAGPVLEIEVHVAPIYGPDQRLSEARMRLRPYSGDAQLQDRYLTEMGPLLFDSLRSYLQATPEQRGRERWLATDPVRIYPVLPDLEFGEVLEGATRNLSYGGVGFRVPRPPASSKLYLHWYRSTGVAAFAVLAEVVRVSPTGSGVCLVGARFPSAGATSAPPRGNPVTDWR